MPYAPYATAGALAVALPTVTLALAGILFALFTALGGGNASFRQVSAIVVFSSAIVVLQQLFVTPLNYARESLSSPTNLSVFLPALDEGTFLARTLGLIDLFYVWWLIVLAVGLGVLYKRRTAPIVWGLFAAYVVIAASVTAIMSVFGGS